MLTITLARAKNPNLPNDFDGQPQQYFAWADNGKPGVAHFPWDEVRKLDEEFERLEPRPAARERMGELLRRFLEQVLTELGGWEFIEQKLLLGEQGQTPVRLRLRFNATELFSLPWALTTLTSARSLGAIQPHVLQFEWASNRVIPNTFSEHARVLFAWSSMGGDVDADIHLEAMKRACPGFDPARDVCANVTIPRLREQLTQATREGRPYHVIHILCHGRELDGRYGLTWEAPDRPRREDLVDGRRLNDTLGPFVLDLHAVVLSACHGGNPGRPGDMFGGVAHHLHRLGIPFVIASQRPLSLHGSIQMTEAFHEALCQRDARVHDAYQAAHAALQDSSLDWASLQLFVAPQDVNHAPGQHVVFAPGVALPSDLKPELAVAYEMNFNIPPAFVEDALAGRTGANPDIIVLRPLGDVGDALPSSQDEWRRALTHAEALVRALGAFATRIHLFARAPLPLMFHLGWRLSRMSVLAYQYQRAGSDDWRCGHDSGRKFPAGSSFFNDYALPEAEACEAVNGRVVLTVEATLPVGEEELARWLGTPRPPAVVRLVASNGPSHEAVRGPEDAARAVGEFRACMDRLGKVPGVREVWLAMACPASLAAALGRGYNPKTQPRLKLFNYRKEEGYVEVPWNGGVEGDPVEPPKPFERPK
ncbi:SAVED domain-containing protein [Corallococcus sp. bb12-1]|uniref:SAVED domain-containing protein n=1 Tax=Corallococcus sp. bb12-1 TaxID=2996784 RepID=UPI0022715C22|nr:SAVED domain-containing protein [Corallococcus sp. bb12-1]MCY1040642.1 SAVED domain-containing protein [Corallococcus sp. bb12-1]